MYQKKYKYNSIIYSNTLIIEGKIENSMFSFKEISKSLIFFLLLFLSKKMMSYVFYYLVSKTND
ncbi:hypothetical protein RIEPE_0355 [Candidatus Riesia pediculicola USDA]|uniref:Uncharacterized protein n=1 Tax=Riesia pediculicola (strain USDA) TaxID=515618 RepID=D4G8E2_RIEPU|nr:hypothetical protein RIEPE_0355 [Candidatus Riesia pediculicola USDA]ARC53830.1 hypothetical protein AOE55_01560 [Candidatus Riesia pediculicola]